jgi:serine/threonine protein phosphatase PrpC
MPSKSLKTRQTAAFHISQLIGDRDEQEDSYGVFYRDDDPEALPLGFIVADGMGGHVGGAIASQTVVDSAKLVLEDSIDLREEALLEEIVEACTDNIGQCVRLNPEFEGMGSTMALIIFHGARFSLLSIGDSLIYGFSKKSGLCRLNDDHSMKPVLDRLIDAGEMSLSEEEYGSKKNMLRSAITGSKVELVDQQWRALQLIDYDFLILASDGIDVLGTEEIERMCSDTSTISPARIADRITRSIAHIGAVGQDNVTVMIIDTSEFLEDVSDA